MAFAIKQSQSIHIPEVVYHHGVPYGRYGGSSLATPQGVNGLNGWFTKLRRAVTSVVKAPFKVVTRVVKGDIKGAAGVLANPFAEKEATRQRTLRRVGGVVTGAVTGLLTGAGPVGMIAGGISGGLQAKKGVRGLKGYGKIALTSAAVAGAAGIATGALAQAGYGAGVLSQSTAQSAILASGKLGMVGTGISAGAPIGASMAMAPVTKAIATGASYVAGGAKTVAMAGASMLGIGKQPPVTGEGVIESEVPQMSYMDTIRQTASLIPNVSGRGADAPAGYGADVQWGAGSVPLPTGAGIPGQYPEAFAPEERDILGSDNMKNVLLIGGLAALVLTFVKTK